MAGVYFHIPFCRQACHYCDFHFSTSTGLEGAMVEAMVKELELQKDYLKGENIETIYFGGGTPSLLPTQDLQKLLATVSKLHRLSDAPEITVEANPDDLTIAKLSELKSIGVNRLSIGIQSFHEEVLTYFNRAHNADEARKCLDDARGAGFNNISIDLIYGVPSANPSLWQEDLKAAFSYQPEHLSAYALTIEEKTVFGKWKSAGKLDVLDEELVAQQYQYLMEEAAKAGYEHYEISNFARKGYRSRHNGSYWNGSAYLGIGPSAHSYDVNSRQFNISNNPIYVRRIQQGEVPFEKEILTVSDRVNEYFFIGLRTTAGCDLNFLKTAYDFELTEVQMRYVDQQVKLGHATLDGRTLKLTNRGRLLADKIASDLFVIAE